MLKSNVWTNKSSKVNIFFFKTSILCLVCFSLWAESTLCLTGAHKLRFQLFIIMTWNNWEHIKWRFIFVVHNQIWPNIELFKVCQRLLELFNDIMVNTLCYYVCVCLLKLPVEYQTLSLECIADTTGYLPGQCS